MREANIFIKKCRLKANLSQSQLSKVLKITDGYVSGLERGAFYPTLNVLRRVNTITGMGKSAKELKEMVKIDKDIIKEETRSQSKDPDLLKKDTFNKRIFQAVQYSIKNNIDTGYIMTALKHYTEKTIKIIKDRQNMNGGKK